MSKLFISNSDGWIVETSDDGEADVRFCSQGGGFVYHLPYHRFHAEFKPYDDRKPFTRFFVTGEWLEPGTTIRAWNDDMRWNGWRMPYFEAKEAHEIARLMGGVYNPKKDQFEFKNANYEDEGPEVYPAHMIETTEGEKKTYPIGAGCWCWDEAS